MPPSPIPAPLPPWARALLQLAPFISAGLQEVLQYIHQLSDNTATTNSEWRHVQQVFEAFGNTEASERWITTHDVVNITGGQVDNSWTDADYTKVDTELTNLATAHLAHCDNSVVHKENRFYRRSFNPLDQSQVFPPSGPPERVITKGTRGALTAQNGQEHQIAMSTTDKTPYPRHWGRNYWPVPSAQSTGADGQFATITVDTFGAALKTAYANLMVAEFFPVVVVTQVNKQPVRGLLTLSGLQVDSVPDVIRRRRPRFPTHKYVATIP